MFRPNRYLHCFGYLPSKCAHPTRLPSSLCHWQSVRWSTKKVSGGSKSTANPRGKALGIKVWPTQEARPGEVIATQHGLKWKAGQNVGIGTNYTLFAHIRGRVMFTKVAVPRHKTDELHGISLKKNTYIHVVPEGDDGTLYHHFKTQRQGKGAYPLNLHWDKVKHDPETAQTALGMLERDLERKRRMTINKNDDTALKNIKMVKKYAERRRWKNIKMVEKSAEQIQ
eukprot:118010_1